MVRYCQRCMPHGRRTSKRVIPSLSWCRRHIPPALMMMSACHQYQPIPPSRKQSADTDAEKAACHRATFNASLSPNNRPGLDSPGKRDASWHNREVPLNAALDTGNSPPRVALLYGEYSGGTGYGQYRCNAPQPANPFAGRASINREEYQRSTHEKSTPFFNRGCLSSPCSYAAKSFSNPRGTRRNKRPPSTCGSLAGAEGLAN